MLKRRKFWKRVLYVLGAFVLLLVAGFIYLVIISKIDPPTPKDISSEKLQRSEPSAGLYTINNNWFRKSNSGLYELYVEGDAFERGVINGKLAKELIVRQEDNFIEQIARMIPSRTYLHFLKYFIGWFNRNLASNITEEYKEEIYGVSESASDQYDYVGTNYQRILNYHAAHDIGHALQNMMLVGCTSFATWNGKSVDSNLIVGRNFDFYVGDKFAEDKIVMFVNPKQGHKFMSITWGGFIGVVSGMNDQGLTVTINAAKSSIPSGSATPVSIVAREVLQYAGNIQEAIAIAQKRKMFVSESFLVASAADNKAVVIEKTPDSLDIYDPNKDYILCANHFQSNTLGHSVSNQEQMIESASPYRYERLTELLDANGQNTPEKTVSILRNREGLHNANIGMGNEKALNQLIAHHAVVFEPKKRIVWVSTAPWQLGKFVAYDLNKVFAMQGMQQNHEICDSALTIGADSFLLTKDFQDFERFRSYKQRIADKQPVDVDSLVASNPEYYHAYVLAGDYLFKQQQYARAIPFYEKALTKVIATKREENHVQEQLKKCKEKLQ